MPRKGLLWLNIRFGVRFGMGYALNSSDTNKGGDEMDLRITGITCGQCTFAGICVNTGGRTRESLMLTRPQNIDGSKCEDYTEQDGPERDDA